MPHSSLQREDSPSRIPLKPGSNLSRNSSPRAETRHSHNTNPVRYSRGRREVISKQTDKTESPRQRVRRRYIQQQRDAQKTRHQQPDQYTADEYDDEHYERLIHNYERSTTAEAAGGDGDDEILDWCPTRELYAGYLVTDHGAVLGPFKLDINDVAIPGVKAQHLNDIRGQQRTESYKFNGAAENGASSERLRNRQTGSHNLNEHSSRSHTMLQLLLDSEMQDTEDEVLYITKRGKLTFVDLAGSEKVKDSGSAADVMVETNNINKSLLVLGNCISALGDTKKRTGHVPYRDSKLTKLLADSLGGNGVTLMIACVSPSSSNIAESMKTLRYASRAKKIKNKPVVKMDPREQLILDLKREVKFLRQENYFLRQQLELPQKPTGKGIDKEELDKLRKKAEEEMKSSDKDKKTVPVDSGLYEMLQEFMVENEDLRKDKSELQQLRERIQREQQMLSKENEHLARRLESMHIAMTPGSLPPSAGSLHRNGGYFPSPLSTPPVHYQHHPSAHPAMPPNGYPVNGWVQPVPGGPVQGGPVPGGPVPAPRPALKPPHHLPQQMPADPRAVRPSQPDFSSQSQYSNSYPGNGRAPGWTQHQPPPNQVPQHPHVLAPPQPVAYMSPPPHGLPPSPNGQHSEPISIPTPRNRSRDSVRVLHNYSATKRSRRYTDNLAAVVNQRNDVMRNELDALDREIQRQSQANTASRR